KDTVLKYQFGHGFSPDFGPGFGPSFSGFLGSFGTWVCRFLNYYYREGA
ncbi:1198_t:CDS:1, partial [Dentiscutata erythropus]